MEEVRKISLSGELNCFIHVILYSEKPIEIQQMDAPYSIENVRYLPLIHYLTPPAIASLQNHIIMKVPYVKSSNEFVERLLREGQLEYKEGKLCNLSPQLKQIVKEPFQVLETQIRNFRLVEMDSPGTFENICTEFILSLMNMFRNLRYTKISLIQALPYGHMSEETSSMELNLDCVPEYPPQGKDLDYCANLPSCWIRCGPTNSPVDFIMINHAHKLIVTIEAKFRGPNATKDYVGKELVQKYCSFKIQGLEEYEYIKIFITNGRLSDPCIKEAKKVKGLVIIDNDRLREAWGPLQEHLGILLSDLLARYNFFSFRPTLHYLNSFYQDIYLFIGMNQMLRIPF